MRYVSVAFVHRVYLHVNLGFAAFNESIAEVKSDLYLSSLVGGGMLLSYLQIVDKGPTSPVIYIERAVRMFMGEGKL